MGNTKRARLKELREWMELTNTTQEQLAAAIGVSQPTISQVLSGLRNLSAEYVARLSKLTGIPVEKLLTGPEAALILKLLGKQRTSDHEKVKDNDRVA
jgi:transcriptional regulator with XRE-family HTH domain